MKVTDGYSMGAKTHSTVSRDVTSPECRMASSGKTKTFVKLERVENNISPACLHMIVNIQYAVSQLYGVLSHSKTILIGQDN